MLTGTPSGVGPLVPGDLITCSLHDESTGEVLDELEFEAQSREGGYLFVDEK